MQLVKKIIANIDDKLNEFANYLNDAPVETEYVPVESRWKKDIYLHQATDKLTAEEAINAIYTLMGLKPPMIIWTRSPLANVFAKVSIDYLSNEDLNIGWGFEHRERYVANNDVRASAWQSVCEAGWKIGDVGLGDAVWSDLQPYEYREDYCWSGIQPSAEYSPLNGLGLMSRANAWFVEAEIVAKRSNNDWLVDLLMRYNFSKQYPNPRECGGSRSMHSGFIREKRKLWHQKNLNSIRLEVSDSDERHFSYPTELILDLQKLRDSAGWIMPYKNICFVSERPEYLHLDERKQLHCETGPAVTYSDGFEIFAWHGTEFPKEWIMTPPSVSEALYWRNTEERRVACEIIGWAAILNELDAVTVNNDTDPEIGELLSVVIPGIGDEKFLRVTCGTGRQFAIPVPPHMKTALEANAWTWGLDASEYRPEVRT